MEDDYRHLQPVKLDIIGSETGRQRYLRDGLFSEPRIADWRNNLTACSQRHNLYFVAHEDTVAVFQPSLPLHTLGSQPQITITPDLANRHARGYLDELRPHSINHLIVGELGSEEILLLSTDSGNVAAYYTSSIQDGIEKDPYKLSKTGRSNLVGVRAFFNHWVYESAWGLSIHKHARMLAVSSNRPHHQLFTGMLAAITVFAFALTSSDEQSAEAGKDEIKATEEDASNWRVWVPDASKPAKLPDRSVNWKTRLEAHKHNIPSISFVNSEDDREGNYLLSTDIEGVTKCWNIWQGVAISTWDFAPPLRRSSNTYLNSQQVSRGWTVLALDPKSFQVVSTHEEFCGDPSENDNYQNFFDITNSIRRIPGHDRSLSKDAALSSPGSDDYDENDGLLSPFVVNWSDDNHEEEEEEEEEEDSDNLTQAEISSEIADDHTTDLELIDDDMQSLTHQQNAIEGGNGSDSGGADETISSNSITMDSFPVEDEEFSADLPNFTMPGGFNSSETYHIQVDTNGTKKVKLWHIGTLASNYQLQTNSGGFSIPALHLSASNLRLFDGNSPREASVYCSDLLSLQWPMYYRTYSAMDRLNMTQYIPELGIVVIGTQIGRAAVCSLTKKGAKGPFGIRVDWILPFEEQEKKRERPAASLLGIAAGPVHGHELSTSNSMSEDDGSMESTFLRDRNDDGVEITFDREVLKLRQDSSSSSSSSADNSSKRQRTGISTAARSRDKSTKSQPPRAPDWTLEPEAWSSLAEFKESNTNVDESWRGMEYSRRYRLVLTYADHTVLTYELSRGVPYVGSAVIGRPNWRNKDELF